MNLKTVRNNLQAMQLMGLERLDAQLLLLHALGQDNHHRAWLLSHDTDEVGALQQKALDSYIRRRLAAEPVAYIVGTKEFFGLSLAVCPDVLIPRPDTECLVHWALEVDAPRDMCVLDLGTGCGAIGLAIKHARPQAQVTLADASQAALAVACSNAITLGLCVQSVQSDWLKNLPTNARFDLIVSNPPYIADGDAHLVALAYEPRLALTSGPSGLDAIRSIVQDAGRFLKPGGRLLLEHGHDQAARVRQLLGHHGFLKVSSRLDFNGIERCTGGALVFAHID